MKLNIIRKNNTSSKINKLFKKALFIFIMGYIIRCLIIIAKGFNIIDITPEYFSIFYFAFISFFSYSELSYYISYYIGIFKENLSNLYKLIFFLVESKGVKVKIGSGDEDLDTSKNNIKKYINCMNNNSSDSSSDDSSRNSSPNTSDCSCSDSSSDDSSSDSSSDSSGNSDTSSEYSHNVIYESNGDTHLIYTNFFRLLRRFDYLVSPYSNREDIPFVGIINECLPISYTDCDIRGIIHYNDNVIRDVKGAERAISRVSSAEYGLRSLLSIQQEVGNGTNNIFRSRLEDSIILSTLIDNGIIKPNKSIEWNISRLSSYIPKMKDLRDSYQYRLIALYKLNLRSIENNCNYTPFILSTQTRQSILNVLNPNYPLDDVFLHGFTSVGYRTIPERYHIGNLLWIDMIQPVSRAQIAQYGQIGSRVMTRFFFNIPPVYYLSTDTMVINIRLLREDQEHLMDNNYARLITR